MVRIVVTPTWAKLIDFESTLPSAVEELARQRKSVSAHDPLLHLGGIRAAASSRTTSPLSSGFSTIATTSRAKSSGSAEAFGEDVHLGERRLQLVGRPGQHRSIHDPRLDGGPGSRSWLGRGRAAGSSRRSLPWMPSRPPGRSAPRGRDRGDVDDHPTLPVVVGLVVAHERRRPTDYVKSSYEG